MSRISCNEYEEMRALAYLEPVGTDAIVYQTAVAASSTSGSKLADTLVFDVLTGEAPSSPEDIAKLFGRSS